MSIQTLEVLQTSVTCLCSLQLYWVEEMRELPLSEVCSITVDNCCAFYKYSTVFN